MEQVLSFIEKYPKTSVFVVFFFLSLVTGILSLIKGIIQELRVLLSQVIKALLINKAVNNNFNYLKFEDMILIKNNRDIKNDNNEPSSANNKKIIRLDDIKKDKSEKTMGANK